MLIRVHPWFFHHSERMERRFGNKVLDASKFRVDSRGRVMYDKQRACFEAWLSQRGPVAQMDRAVVS